MRFGVGCVFVLTLVLAKTSLAEDDDGEDLTDEQAAIVEEEKELLEEYKEGAKEPGITKKKQQKLVRRVRNALLKLYERSKGDLSEDALVLLGDLSRVVTPKESKTMTKSQHDEIINKAGVFYEDAYNKHNSVKGYFHLAQCVQALAVEEGRAGNATGKFQLMQQASQMFTQAAAKGYGLAYKELATMCEKNEGFTEDGCPREMQNQSLQFYEYMAKEEPTNPAWPSKVALLRSRGFGQDMPDLTAACHWAAAAARANQAKLSEVEAKLIESGVDGELQPSEYQQIGFDMENFVMHGNCQYFHNFERPGDALDRAQGRRTLQEGLDLKMSLLSENDLEGRTKLKQHHEKSLSMMIGPEVEPTHSGKIEWADNVHGLGYFWNAYVWSPQSVGIFWSQTTRLPPTRLKVTKKDADLIDFECEQLRFNLEADSYSPAVPGVSPAYLRGKATYSSSDGDTEGNFTFTIVPQRFNKAEL